MKRRTVLAGLAAGAAAAWWVRPGAEGAPYDDYFRTLNDELKRNGPMRPCMVIDLDRLDRNIAAVNASIRAPKHLRVVAKSLPSLPLLHYIMERASTQRLMAFHQPFLNEEARAFPHSDILLGKPLPVRSAEMFYRQLQGAFDPARQLQWLLDTPERLQQYAELAAAQNLKLRINIEIDVGLHRGGVADDAQLAQMLALVIRHPEQLEFSGFMGYDPHVTKLPAVAGSRDSLFAKVMATYQARVDLVRAQFPQLWHEGLTLNTAGSPTYTLHGAETLSNDLAVGSALLQPTDFDLDTLAAHVPAAFIATPVLKVQDGVRIPEMDALSSLLRRWDPNQRQAYFIYGGHWLARYEAPAGLRASGLYGRSSNQELATASAAAALQVDDQVFLRPTQSEAVLLQFGDLLAVRGGRIVDRWPVLSQSS
jgi:D-serine deaminase-like pyridoxal phosphate-dependent protein